MIGLTAVDFRVHLTKTVPRAKRVWTRQRAATALILLYLATLLSSTSSLKGWWLSRPEGVGGGEA